MSLQFNTRPSFYNRALTRVKEAIRFEFDTAKWPIVLVMHLACLGILSVGLKLQALNIASRVYRTGWPASFRAGLGISRKVLVDRTAYEKVQQESLAHVNPTEDTAKYFADPSEMLNMNVLVLKSPEGAERGALVIKYSQYFGLFPRLFDVSVIAQHYNIVLEPSWAGLCDHTLLGYGALGTPVFVMAYEPRDFRYLQTLDGPLKPIAIGPSWFVDHHRFGPPPAGTHRDIDIVVVAAWATFKRHDQLFRGIARFQRSQSLTKVVLVGYPADLDLAFIEQLAELHGIRHLIEFHEWLDQREVSELYRRSRVSILWSRFEGDNRAIVESMLCDTPVIVRAGHNYGHVQPHINSETGLYATEAELPRAIEAILHGKLTFSPRAYILREHHCELATSKLSAMLRDSELTEGRPWTRDLAVKTNYLHGMHYFEPEDEKRFVADYEFLLSHRRAL